MMRNRNTARRVRLQETLSPATETETIERILRKRLRERRERRIAKERREAEHQKQAPWADPKQIVGEGNPHELETAVRSGRVRIRFVHTSRWWQVKEAAPREAIRLGSDGKSLVDGGGWELRVNKDDWHAYLEKTAAPTSSADVPPAAKSPTEVITNDMEMAATPPAAPSTSQRKRAKVQAQLGTYSDHVAEHLNRTGEYPSEEDDRIWAQNNSYVQKHVTTVLRPQYREGLAKPEQDRFQDTAKGKHRQNKDPGP